jgi:hypothetical protein
MQNLLVPKVASLLVKVVKREFRVFENLFPELLKE